MAQLVNADEEGIRIASAVLKEGGLVAFPTETVYGLGANALNSNAVRKIFIAKGRPLSDPLIVHTTDVSRALELIDGTDLAAVEIFKLLGRIFWPGPLTLVVKASRIIPDEVTANTGYVGIRVPSNKVAMSLLSECQLPLAAPSANTFGHVSPTRAEHVLKDLADSSIIVLKGIDNNSNEDTCRIGIESTVAKIDSASKTIFIFRQGAVSRAQLTIALTSAGIDWLVSEEVKKFHQTTATSELTVGSEAPGMCLTHYAPDVPCYVLDTEATPLSPLFILLSPVSYTPLNEENKNILTTAVILDFNAKVVHLASSVLAYRDLSSAGDVAEAARCLFEYLRWAESLPGARTLLVCQVNAFDGSELVLGIQDRIFRASSGKVMQLRSSLKPDR